MKGLLQTARERKLDRVGAAYAVTGWLAVQAASIALPAFDAPGWMLKWLIVVTILGFPVALVAAWVAGAHRAAAESRLVSPIRGWIVLGTLAVVILATAVQLALMWSVPPPVPQAKPHIMPASIAVLPFANLSGDPERRYFSDGIADQLITELARMPKLRVAARTSSFAFEGKATDIKTIAHALNVGAIVEGSVREEGNRVRIAAELIDAASGFQIWSDSYDRDLTDILSLQDEIARAIASALTRHLFGNPIVAQAPKPRRTIKPEAYRTYLQGQFYLAQRSEEGIARAIELFQRVTELAPDYSDGFAALAFAHATRALNFAQFTDIAPAMLAVKQSLALDNNNATALMAHSTVSLMQWKWKSAADDLKRLQSLDGNSAPMWHARSVLFSYMALSELALQSTERAAQINPLSFIDEYNVALHLMNLHRLNEALKVARNATSLQPGNQEALSLVCRVEAARKNFAEAKRIAAQLNAQTAADAPPGPSAACNFYLAVALKDFPAARKIADMAASGFPDSGVTASDIGSAYALINDIDKAMVWFQRAYDLREPWVFQIPYTTSDVTLLFADARWKALRARPEFREWENARTEIAREFQTGE